jgi:hypothetical protein
METEKVVAIAFATIIVIALSLGFGQSMYADHLISKAIANGVTPQQARCAFGDSRSMSIICETVHTDK